jgi:hypothetical protein
METYVREHHTQLRRRLESVKRIHKASDTVETRLQELTQMQEQLQVQHDQFTKLQNQLVNLLVEAEVADTPEELRDGSGELLYWDHKVSF